MNGTGMTFIGGNNTYAGGTNINSGTLAVAPAQFRYFRFTTTARRGGGNSLIQLAEMQIFSGPAQIIGAVATTPTGGNPPNETPAKAVDNNVATKWLDLTLQPLTLDFGAPLFATQYVWATANDATDRDPVRWK